MRQQGCWGQMKSTTDWERGQSSHESRLRQTHSMSICLEAEHHDPKNGESYSEGEQLVQLQMPQQGVDHTMALAAYE